MFGIIKYNIWYLPALLLLIMLLVAAYPGGWSYDTINQWYQVTGRNPVNNWHPPLMAYLWKTLSFFPLWGGLFFLHIAGFAFGIWLFCGAVFEKTSARIIASLGLIFFPPNLGLVSTVWKDTGLFVCVLIIYGLIARYMFKKRTAGYLWATFPFLLYGFGVRQNAFFLLIFPAVLITDLMIRHYAFSKSPNFILRITSGLAVSFTILVIASLIQMPGVRKTDKLGFVLLWDVTRISQMEGRNLVPAEFIKEKFRGMPDEQILSLTAVDYVRGAPSLFHSNLANGESLYRMSLVRDGNSGISRDLAPIILRHPISYFFHRLKLFQAILFKCNGMYTLSNPLHNKIDPGHTFYLERLLHKGLESYLAYQGIPFFPFCAYAPYMVIAFFFLSAFAWRQFRDRIRNSSRQYDNKWRLIANLSIASFALPMSLFFFTPGFDTRLLMPSILCVELCALLLLSMAGEPTGGNGH